MDGIHDLGGREGFGPVQVSTEYEGFHSDWEARVFSLIRGMARPNDWSIDWFRHCRELIPPVEYLTRPYYDQWLQAYAAMMINSGVATMDEIVTGRSSASVDAPLSKPLRVKDVPQQLLVGQRFDGEAGKAPDYSVGDTVRVSKTRASGHTRLPAYVRGATGVVTHYRGDHVLPDANAVCDKRAEALYTVGFAASDLWPGTNTQDRVNVDLWESYLVGTA